MNAFFSSHRNSLVNSFMLLRLIIWGLKRLISSKNNIFTNVYSKFLFTFSVYFKFDIWHVKRISFQTLSKCFHIPTVCDNEIILTSPFFIDLKSFYFSDCARDFILYQHQLICHGTGNYLPLQFVVDEIGTKYFCVDSDGFSKTGLFDEMINNCTNYY